MDLPGRGNKIDVAGIVEVFGNRMYQAGVGVDRKSTERND